jgi:hypothetical protein
MPLGAGVAAASRLKGTDERRQWFYVHSQHVGSETMTKHLLAGIAAVVLMSGVAFAENYPPAPPPSMPLAPPPAVASPSDNNPPPVSAPPSVGVPGSTTTTTTVAPTTGHTTTITKGVDANGNEITKKDSYKEGVSGSSESHTTTATDPDSGTTTTRSTTTTTPR